MLQESSFSKHPIFDDKDDGSLFYIISTSMAVQGHLPVHNSMDVVVAEAFSYGNEEGPKLLGGSAYGALSSYLSKPYGLRWLSCAFIFFPHHNKRQLKCTCNQGVVCAGVTCYVQGIVMNEKGPIFFITFNPLYIIIMALLGSIILAEEITQERVIGAVIIVIGLHSLIWGKSNDHLDKKRVADLPMAARNGISRGFTEDHTGSEIPLARNLGI